MLVPSGGPPTPPLPVIEKNDSADAEGSRMPPSVPSDAIFRKYQAEELKIRMKFGLKFGHVLHIDLRLDVNFN